MIETSSNRNRAFGLLLAAFIAGGVVGVVGDRAYMISLVLRQADHARREVQRGVQADQIPVPLEQLGLTPDETSRLHAIARRWRPQAGDALNEMRRRVSGMENSMFAEMLCVLPQDKRDRYLHGLQESKFAQEIIDQRFALVHANRCPVDSTAAPPASPR